VLSNNHTHSHVASCSWCALHCAEENFEGEEGEEGSDAQFEDGQEEAAAEDAAMEDAQDEYADDDLPEQPQLKEEL
jgi:hypothetical protein